MADGYSDQKPFVLENDLPDIVGPRFALEILPEHFNSPRTGQAGKAVFLVDHSQHLCGTRWQARF